MSTIIEESLLTCPRCGFEEIQNMPTDACLWFHECNGCKTLLKPEPGDCCVFCSFGSVPCPPIQLKTLESAEGSCCGTA